MAETRKGEVTFKGNPIELVGPKLKPGDPAPDFICVGAGLSLVKLADTAGKARLFNVVPSLDTPVCNKQTKRFAEELTALGDKVAAYTVSLDLPFAHEFRGHHTLLRKIKHGVPGTDLAVSPRRDGDFRPDHRATGMPRSREHSGSPRLPWPSRAGPRQR